MIKVPSRYSTCIGHAERLASEKVSRYHVRVRGYAFFGAIAQLGERNTGSVEVGGSIPPGSTNALFQLAPPMPCFKKFGNALHPNH